MFMGSCPIDHSLSDVKKKLAEQREFLPEKVATDLAAFLTEEKEQKVLNDVFHLLKKYDLASVDERREREQKLLRYV